MLIRTATLEEAPALAELARRTYADAFGGSMSAPDLAAHLEKNLSTEKIAEMLAADTFLLAEADGRMVGYVQFGRCDFEQADQATDQELRRLYVLAEYQNRGVGTQLIEAALEQPGMKDAP